VDLESVSCPSAGNCGAVGGDIDGGYEQGLVASEVSGRWSAAVEATLPDNASANPLDAGLTAVSCASAGNCSAVGGYTDSVGNEEGILVNEVDGTWAAGIELTLPATGTVNPDVSLVSISCASPGNCSAVGRYTDSVGNEEGILVNEVDGTWGTGIEPSLPAEASPTPQGAHLNSVSCASPGNCSAVGFYVDSSGNSQGLLLNEVDGTWGNGIEAALPLNAASYTQGYLNSVSCASPGNCSAVGHYDSSNNRRGLLLSEDSGNWETGTEAALPAGAADNPFVWLGAVSCASVGNCSVLGSYTDSSGNGQGLLLSEDSGNWGTGTKVVLPAGVATDPQLNLVSLSCASVGNCGAAGYYNDSQGNTQGLLLSEVSGTWEDGVEAPLPADAAIYPRTHLYSISCSSGDDCSAVGYYDAVSGDGLVETLAPVVSRVFGQDAIDTSIAISQAEFPTTGSAGAVVLARSDYFSDALAGGPLAAKLDAPLLITPGASSSQSLDPRVLAEIERVLPEGKTVYILGGDLALSPAIDTTLEGVGYSVVREAGADEYATAVDIAQLLGDPSTIFEVTGLDFDDAASAVPAAVVSKGAILLTDGSTQAPETAAYLSAHPGDTRFAIGGPLAAAGADPSATAVYGGDLYGTSVAVATRFFSQPPTFGAATSATFADALSAGPVLGLQDAPMLLVPPSGALPASVDRYLSSVAGGFFGGTLYGGPLAVGEDVLSELNSAI
jgi:putative cell wall-binding protein